MSQNIIYDLDINAYHSSQGISKTGLDRINRSPAFFYDVTLNPDRPPERQRAGQLEGHLAHCSILEPDEFAKRYAVGPDVSRATKAWKEFEASLPAGVLPIKPEQYEMAMRQAESVLKLPDIAEALSSGRPEVSGFWSDPETGVLCRCRPDWVHDVGEDSCIIVDVKTYSDASPEEFVRQAARKRYDVQDAFYSDGFQLASGKEVLAFIFLVVETEWPYQASAVMLDAQSKESGRNKYQHNLKTYAQCLSTNEWPGYSTGIEQVSLPAWAQFFDI